MISLPPRISYHFSGVLANSNCNLIQVCDPWVVTTGYVYCDHYIGHKFPCVTDHSLRSNSSCNLHAYRAAVMFLENITQEVAEQTVPSSQGSSPKSVTKCHTGQCYCAVKQYLAQRITKTLYSGCIIMHEGTKNFTYVFVIILYL